MKPREAFFLFLPKKICSFKLGKHGVIWWLAQLKAALQVWFHHHTSLIEIVSVSCVCNKRRQDACMLLNLLRLISMLSCNMLQSNGVVKSECHSGLVFMRVQVWSIWRERFIKLAYYFITSLLDITRKRSHDYVFLMYSITTFLHYSPLIPLKRQAHSLAAKLNEST